MTAYGGWAAWCLALSVVTGTVMSAQAQRRTADITERGLSPSAFPRTTRLADNVYAYEQIDPTKGNVTVNNLIVITPVGVVVADGQGTVENTRRLVAEIAALTDRPITHVIVASEHRDHTGGNSAFPASATFYASPVSAERLRQGAQPTRPGAPPVVVPTALVAQGASVALPGTGVQVRSIGRAHTGGDLVVVLPAQRIVWASEVFLNRIFPSMANSYPTEWVATLRALEAMDADVFVPAHGFVDRPALLKEEMRHYRLAIERVISEARRLHAAGVSLSEAPARADLGEFRAWTRYDSNIGPALARVYQEIEGTLPE